MKRLLFVMALMISICSVAMAQNEKRGERRQFSQEEMIQHQTDRMAEQLSLTAEQKTAVLELNKKYAGKTGFSHRPQGTQNERPSREEMEKMRTEREEAQKAYNEDLKAILSADQYKKYEESLQQMRQRGPRGGQRGGRPHGNWGHDNGGSFGHDNGASGFDQNNTNERF